MTDYYVNDAGTANGWVAGVDGVSNGLSDDSPVATWDYLHDTIFGSSPTVGDRVIFNSSGSTEYTAPNSVNGNIVAANSPYSVASIDSNGDYKFKGVTYDVSADEWVADPCISGGGFSPGIRRSLRNLRQIDVGVDFPQV